jgi:hypothetical protein
MKMKKKRLNHGGMEDTEKRQEVLTRSREDREERQEEINRCDSLRSSFAFFAASREKLFPLPLLRVLRASVVQIFLILSLACAASAEDGWDQPPMVGMYVHQHWSYNHPYAARTWTYEDWTGYLDGLKKLGYNTVLIWPVLETIPNPMTPSDQENLDKLARVIDFAHDQLDMRVLITLCPNVVARDAEAAKYTFVERPFFYCDLRINPADAVAMGNMIAFREQLFTPLKKADGVFIIDSDPGGYPGSDNLEFVSLLNMHRTMFNRLNPDMELYYWIHAGWEAYCRYYETGEFAMGENTEVQEAIRLLAKADPEPWGIASGRGPDIANDLGLRGKVISYQYGGIEGEPSFPLTNFNSEYAYRSGQQQGPRGTMGNAQTHAVQLPNTFLFARGATGQPMPTTEDYVAFANRLIPGHGDKIVTGWQVINSPAAAPIRAAVEALRPLQNQSLEAGDLKGLLFGDPQRFIKDLVQMLDMRATLEDLHAAAMANADPADLTPLLQAFVNATGTWQNTHNYKNNWVWPRMEEALLKVDPEKFTPLFQERSYTGEGNTPFERIQSGYKHVETFTPRLIEAMRQSAAMLQEK